VAGQAAEPRTALARHVHRDDRRVAVAPVVRGDDQRRGAGQRGHAALVHHAHVGHGRGTQPVVHRGAGKGPRVHGFFPAAWLETNSSVMSLTPGVAHVNSLVRDQPVPTNCEGAGTVLDRGRVKRIEPFDALSA
jgi:hypothetical protein